MKFPDTFATDRLIAERLRPEHAAEIFAMHQDVEHMAFLGGIKDAEQTAAYMERNLRHWEEHGFGLWIVRDAYEGEVVGRALLRHLLLEGTDEIEVGYGFYPSCWGRGLASEIAGACLEHARTSLGLASVVAITLPTNLRSQRVMAKIGMAFEREVEHEGQPHVLYRARFSGPG